MSSGYACLTMCDVKAREKSATNLVKMLAHWVAENGERACNLLFLSWHFLREEGSKWRRRDRRGAAHYADRAEWWLEPSGVVDRQRSRRRFLSVRNEEHPARRCTYRVVFAQIRARECSTRETGQR